jgi:hypothetical protein
MAYSGLCSLPDNRQIRLLASLTQVTKAELRV